MNCPTNGFPTIWHNELCAFTVSLLSELYMLRTYVEPQITGETIPLALANVEDGAHLDVAACGFWGFLDVKF